MEYFVGLDVPVEETSICVVGDDGKVVLETSVATDPELITGAVRTYAGCLRRVGHEAGSLSPWLHTVMHAMWRDGTFYVGDPEATEQATDSWNAAKVQRLSIANSSGQTVYQQPADGAKPQGGPRKRRRSDTDQEDGKHDILPAAAQSLPRAIACDDAP